MYKNFYTFDGIFHRAGKNTFLSRSVLRNYVKLTKFFTERERIKFSPARRAGKNGFSFPLGVKNRLNDVFSRKIENFLHFHVKIDGFHKILVKFRLGEQIYKNTVLAQGGGKE